MFQYYALISLLEIIVSAEYDSFSNIATAVVSEQPDTNGNSSKDNIETMRVYLVLSIVIFVFLLILCLLVLVRFTRSQLISYKGRKKSLNSPSSKSYKDRSTDTTANTLTAGTITTEATLTNQITSIRTASSFGNPGETESTLWDPNTRGYYIPAFLQYSALKDFRQDKLLAKASSSILHIGTAINPSLIKSTEHHKKPILAVKEPRGNLDISPQTKIMFYQEISIMYYLKDHRNIVKLFGFSEKPYCILMKHYRTGNLYQYLFVKQNPAITSTASSTSMNSITNGSTADPVLSSANSLNSLISAGRSSSSAKKEKTLTKRVQMSFISDIAKGILFMHKNGIAHCDLKAENILIDMQADQYGQDKSPHCVIADFGISTVVDESRLVVNAYKPIPINGISKKYSSPESLTRFLNSAAGVGALSGNEVYKYDAKSSDIYAYSMIMYDILCKVPVWSIDSKSTKRSISSR